jgi:hypothetical protein
MNTREAALSQLDILITQGEQIIRSYRISGFGGIETQLPERQVRAFITSAFAAVERIAGRNSEYYGQLVSIPPGKRVILEPEIPAAAHGALLALRAAVDAGLLGRLEAIVRANVHDDLLSQAAELLNASYDVAAMVLIGAVLEQHLQKLCTSRSLSWKGSGSLSKYNDLLRQVLYDQVTWRRIQAIADLRNHAAHGEITLVRDNSGKGRGRHRRPQVRDTVAIRLHIMRKPSVV